MRPANFGMMMAVLGLALPASATIVSWSGMVNVLGSPPGSCVPTALTGQTAYAWNEKQNVLLNLTVDMVNNPGSSNSPTPGAVNGVYDSHFLHLDDQSGVGPFTGTLTFNNPIVAVIFKNTLLDNSDGPAGAITTVYPTGNPWRGLPTAPSSFVTIVGNTLSFNLNTFHPVYVVDQVRILTQAPTPGSAALLGLAGITCVRRRRHA